MSDEEREALEILKSFEPDDLVECAIYLQVIEKIKNLIEKQSKEIEELKVVNQMQKYRIEVIDEREFISRDEVENIITSEIKEIEKFKAKNDLKTTNYHLYRVFVDEVLQSILDKIKGDDK